MAFRLDRLRKLRKTLKLNQKTLGDKIGVSARMISDYERGRYVPDTEHLALMADALNTNIDYLMNRTTYPKPLSPLHYQVWDAFERSDQNALLDLLRKHLIQQGLGEKPIARPKPSPK